MKPKRVRLPIAAVVGLLALLLPLASPMPAAQRPSLT